MEDSTIEHSGDVVVENLFNTICNTSKTEVTLAQSPNGHITPDILEATPNVTLTILQ
jgi:hypothetical protein